MLLTPGSCLFQNCLSWQQMHPFIFNCNQLERHKHLFDNNYWLLSTHTVFTPTVINMALLLCSTFTMPNLKDHERLNFVSS